MIETSNRSSTPFKLLGTEDIDAILQLRRSEYLRAYPGQVTVKGLDWNQVDRQSTHLGFYSHNSSSLIAYLRLSLFSSKQRLEMSTLIPTPDGLRPPFALLARAACDPSHAQQGWHSRLRCRALEICRQLDVSCVLGTIEESAIRWPSLNKLGYKILSVQPSWGETSLIKNSRNVLLIGLTSTDEINVAIAQLLEKYQLLPLDRPLLKNPKLVS